MNNPAVARRHPLPHGAILVRPAFLWVETRAVRALATDDNYTYQPSKLFVAKVQHLEWAHRQPMKEAL